MEELPIFVAGLIVGLVLAAGAAALRGRSVADLGSADAQRPAEPGAGADVIPADSGVAAATHGLHLTRKVVHRLETKLEPGGILTITVDGQVYHHVDDVPDAATREQVRATLQGLPNMVTDPVQREKVAGELHDAGLDQTPS